MFGAAGRYASRKHRDAAMWAGRLGTTEQRVGNGVRYLNRQGENVTGDIESRGFRRVNWTAGGVGGLGLINATRGPSGSSSGAVGTPPPHSTGGYA